MMHGQKNIKLCHNTCIFYYTVVRRSHVSFLVHIFAAVRNCLTRFDGGEALLASLCSLIHPLRNRYEPVVGFGSKAY
jgi:hypothetical protein